jgi:3-hydroxyisobutyrate dehydrogenase
MRVSFLGLGVMGYPMAGHLRRAGFDVTVFNRTRQKAEAWVKEYGGSSAPSPAEAAANADVVLSCVGRDDDMREIALGRHGAFITMKRDAVFIDHTTASAGLARELAEAAHQRGMHFVDAPVSGGEQGAKNGQLTIMCGGTAMAYAKAEPVISTYARQCRLMGEAGAGQLTKMVNQICIAGLVQALSEFQHGFAVEWMRKDLAICLQEAARNGTSLPVTSLVDQFYAEVEKMGGKRWDTSSLFARQEAFKKGK